MGVFRVRSFHTLKERKLSSQCFDSICGRRMSFETYCSVAPLLVVAWLSLGMKYSVSIIE